jgi:hypothetical protein
VTLHALLQPAASRERELSWGMGKPEVEDGFLAAQADFEASLGHIAKARELSRRPTDSAVRSGSKERRLLGKDKLRCAKQRSVIFRKQSVIERLTAAELQIRSAPDRNAVGRMGHQPTSRNFCALPLAISLCVLLSNQSLCFTPQGHPCRITFELSATLLLSRLGAFFFHVSSGHRQTYSSSIELHNTRVRRKPSGFLQVAVSNARQSAVPSTSFFCSCGSKNRAAHLCGDRAARVLMLPDVYEEPLTRPTTMDV